jgi:hypothetical protein
MNQQLGWLDIWMAGGGIGECPPAPRFRRRYSHGGQVGAAIPPPEGSGIDGLFFIYHNGQFSRSRKKA